MIIVHHLNNSRSQRILWLLEELGVPYELKVYRRDKLTRLAPPELKAIHPLGKSPVVTDGGAVIAESAVIIEYLVEKYGHLGTGELAQLAPPAGTPAYWQARYWMHYAEGSLMNWLVMKLVFSAIPQRPMPFFVKPIARSLCDKVQSTLIDPNLQNSLNFIEAHLAQHTWFAGNNISMADFQMSFGIEALLARSGAGGKYLQIDAYHRRMRARPAYQRAESKGGPTLMTD